MAAASGLSETMTLDDDSGAHEGNDEDNGDDAYGIESHGEQDAIARQVQLLLDLDRLGQIIARNRSNSADRCLACARDRPSMVGATINRRDMNHSERNYEIQQLETSRHEAAKAVCLSAAALDDASIIGALNHINDERAANVKRKTVTAKNKSKHKMKRMLEKSKMRRDDTGQCAPPLSLIQQGQLCVLLCMIRMLQWDFCAKNHVVWTDVRTSCNNIWSRCKQVSLF
jgi:hypothetical protein